MKIYFDPREGSKDFLHIPPLDTCSELLASSIMNNYGDFLVLGNGPGGVRHIAGEIKSLADFVQSLNSGRLCATQLPKMFPHCDQLYLLVYGQTRKRSGELQWSMDNGHSWSKAYGGKRTHESTLLSTCTEFEAAGIHFHLHPSRESLALRIHTIATWWSRKWSSHTLFQYFDRSTMPARNDRAGLCPKFNTDAEHNIAVMADRLPNVGAKTVQLASKHFDSVWDLITANREQWLELPNVGDLTVNTIHEFIHTGAKYTTTKDNK